MLYRLITFFLSIAALTATAGITVYPAGKGVPLIDDYTVRVRELPSGKWHDIDVYPVKVDEVKDAGHNVHEASMAYFDFEGKVEVEIIPRYAEPASARVRPLSYGIESILSGDTLHFELNRPANLSIEFNGDIFRNLHLFVGSPVDRPTPEEIASDGNLIYFGPGLHELKGGRLNVGSGKRVFVDGGAKVVGLIDVDGSRDVKIWGRGEVHPEERGHGIKIVRSKNVEVDGPIVTQLPVIKSDSVKVRNVKAISSYGWGDGFNIYSSNDVEYDGLFARNSDDCHTVYASRDSITGGCRNIMMKNSTLWADVAHPFMIGLHGSALAISPDAPADTIKNLYYTNIDILDHNEKQIDYQGCFAINCGDNNIVDGVTFDNVRVENFREGQLFNLRIFHNKKYCAAPGSIIENILFKDIVYNGNNAEISIIAGYDDDRIVRNLTFENLVINGVKITDDMPGKPVWYKTGDMARIFVGEHVENVKFQ